MLQTALQCSVVEAAEKIKKSLQEKGFTLFADIDHQANAHSVDLELAASRLLIFGNPVAGTKLLQSDINISLDLPLRLAIVEKEGRVYLLHQETKDFTEKYQVSDHPVLEKVADLFATLVSEL